MIADGTLLIEAALEPSLLQLQRNLADPAYRGADVEIWTFDSPTRRAALAQTLRARDMHVWVRSAYKPLLHSFQEEIDLDGIDRVVVRYPVVEGATPLRFRLEAYPLGDLIGGRAFELHPLPCATALPAYQIELLADGELRRSLRVEAPNYWHIDHLDERCLAPTGWIRLTVPGRPDLDCDARFETDQEKLFRLAMIALRDPAARGGGPQFHDLRIELAAPFHDRVLGVGQEHVSTAEAMHEDLYFSGLELFRKMNGHPKGDRRFAPGRIIPDIRISNDSVSLRITAAASVAPVADAASTPAIDLDHAAHWLDHDAIAAQLSLLGGRPVNAQSRLGQTVAGRWFPGSGPALLISAGQHPNEPSGPVGALRAAHRLRRAGQGNFVVAPMMNPDGLSLYRDLCARFPAHMNHAARYTAQGNDLEYAPRGYENELYYTARDLTRAALHVNLHGYPAHEWTRPFTGYLPRDFESWTLPKGFFLILRHLPGWRDHAMLVLARVAARLAADPRIAAHNAEQVARYSRYVEVAPFRLLHGVPYFLSEVPDGLFPVTLITEAPDETVYGEEFILQHEAQTLAVLAAREAAAEFTTLPAATQT